MNIVEILRDTVQEEILVAGNCPLPPSINNTYKVRIKRTRESVKPVFHASAASRQWKSMNREYVSYLWRKPPYELQIGYRALLLFKDDKKRRDCSNRIKIFEDSLEGAVIKDDVQIMHFDVTKVIGPQDGMYFVVYKYEKPFFGERFST